MWAFARVPFGDAQDFVGEGWNVASAGQQEVQGVGGGAFFAPFEVHVRGQAGLVANVQRHGGNGVGNAVSGGAQDGVLADAGAGDFHAGAGEVAGVTDGDLKEQGGFSGVQVVVQPDFQGFFLVLSVVALVQAVGDEAHGFVEVVRAVQQLPHGGGDHDPLHAHR